MYLVSYLFDAIDGKVARVTNCGSKYGAWFDIAVDRISIYLVTLGLLISYDFEPVYTVVTFTFMFLFLFGFESRYNIQLNQLVGEVKAGRGENFLSEGWRAGVSQYVVASNGIGLKNRYKNWCIRRGVIFQPVSLVELMMLLLVVAPQFGFYIETSIFVCFLLVLRICLQQRYWFLNDSR